MRSQLFIPADDEKKLGKGVASGADALILDLEDSVSAPRKVAARAVAAQYIAATRPLERRPLLYVRVNALDTPYWEQDLAGVIGSRPDGVVLPKARSGADVHTLSIALNHAEERAGAPKGTTRIVALTTEVPISLLQMHIRRVQRATGGHNLGCRGFVRRHRRLRQPGSGRTLDLPLSARAQPLPVHGRGRQRAADRHRVRQFPRRGGPARRGDGSRA